MSNIGVVGWYGHDNCGDESYKLSFRQLFPQHEFTFSEFAPEMPNVLDALVIGGGDVVHPYYLESFGRHQVPKHALSVSISNDVPLNDFATVAVRDRCSLERANKLGARSPVLIPDFAFALTPNKERGKVLVRHLFQGAELFERLVTVVPNSYLLPRYDVSVRDTQRFDAFVNEMSVISDNTSASFLYLPFGGIMPSDDRVFCGWLGAKCKFTRKNQIVWERLSVQDTIDIIAASDVVVSMRLHSSIFSCVANTPFVDITHNHKNAGFLDSVGLSKLSVPYHGFAPERVANMVSGFLNNSVEITNELAGIARKQKQTLKDFAASVRLV
jgi:polysaccharide pyruvyl transferase WcaK-like protein